MLPRINFGFILCTYLPGIFLTLVTYVWFIRYLFHNIDSDFAKIVISIYVAVSPLIFGLFIDALRHLLEQLNEWLSNRNKRMCVLLIKMRVFWLHWDHFLKDDLEASKEKYGEHFLSHMIDIYTIQYHMYEFFYNLALALIISALPYLIWRLTTIHSPQQKYWFILLAAVIAGIPIAFIFGWLMNRLNKALINAYFSEYQNV